MKYELRPLGAILRRLVGRQPPIASVILCSNGLIAAFDANGDQIPYYQGYVGQAVHRILADAQPTTQFESYGPSWAGGKVSREQFISDAHHVRPSR